MTALAERLAALPTLGPCAVVAGCVLYSCIDAEAWSYRAWHLATGRECVVRLYPTAVPTAARGPSHPALEPVLRRGTRAGLGWAVSAAGSDHSLSAWVARRGAVAPANAASMVAALARGLAALHAAGVAHGAVHPAHGILRDDGPRLLAPGLPMPPAAPLTFVAPELQRQNGATATPAADQFALAAVLVFLLRGGRLPATLQSPQPTDLADLVPDAPEDLEAIIATAGASEPAGRYPDMTVLAAELDAFARRAVGECETVCGQGEDTVTALHLPGPDHQAQTQLQAALRVYRSRRRRRLATALAAAMAVLGGLAGALRPLPSGIVTAAAALASTQAAVVPLAVVQPPATAPAPAPASALSRPASAPAPQPVDAAASRPAPLAPPPATRPVAAPPARDPEAIAAPIAPAPAAPTPAAPPPPAWPGLHPRTGNAGGFDLVLEPPGKPPLRLHLRAITAADRAPFLIGRAEVTRAEFAAVAEHGLRPAKGQTAPGADGLDLPLVNVSWQQVMAWLQSLQALLQRDGLPYQVGLPTRDEWLFAARRDHTWPYPWGTELPDPQRASIGRYLRGDAEARAAGASPDGVLDLIGSVEEWGADAPTPGSDLRVVLGLSHMAASELQTLDQAPAWRRATYRFAGLGFRIVLRPR